jgi:hypothetical protein
MSNFWGTLRHAVRMFRMNPGFTFAPVAALALGIGSPPAAKQARQVPARKARIQRQPCAIGRVGEGIRVCVRATISCSSPTGTAEFQSCTNEFFRSADVDSS